MKFLTETYAPLIGRILIGGFFVWNGVQEVINFPGTISIFSNMGLPAPEVFAGIAAAIELCGGVALVMDFRTRFVSIMLTLYVLIASMLTFDPTNAAHVQIFLENMALIGGLLYAASYKIHNKTRR